MSRIVVSFGYVLIAIFAWSQITPALAKEDKPNIIVILADDLGYGDISPYGQKKIKTPNLASLAKRGMKFTQFYAGAAVCAPSRSALLEGLHTGHSFIRGNKQHPNGQGQLPFPEDAITISKRLKESGYKTAMVGKWGLGNLGTSGDPFKHGWDFYYGYMDQVLAHNYYPDHLYKNGQKVPVDNEPVYLPNKFNGLGSYTPEPKEYSHDLLMKEALGFIKQNQENPFFLYLAITLPHENGEQAKGLRFEVPSQGIYADKPWTKEQKDYAAMVTYIDKSVGDVVKALEDKGIDEKTLILFCSDNGPMRVKRCQAMEFFDSNGALRGGKCDPYEGGVRSPLIAYWPSVVAAGKVSDHICAAWDFFPTVCELAGTKVPKGLDGISLLPTLKGKNQPEHESLYWEFHGKGGWLYFQAARMGKWKAVRLMPKGTDSAVQLFNLDEDLAETKDVAKEHPMVAARMIEIINESHSPSKHFPFEWEK